jgi:nitroimidazol reductase NimA-like FMN-containing flavoprotein (pyridoxamine 5'-phosphate oxidase superfamily)
MLKDPRAHLRPVGADDSEPPRTVAEVMTPDPVSIAPSADEAEAAAIMLQRGVRSVPVVSEGRLLGVISATDLLAATLRGDWAVAEGVRARLLEDGPQANWSVEAEDGMVMIAGPADRSAREAAVSLAETVPGVVRVRYQAAVSVKGDQPRSVATDRRGLRVLDVDTCLTRLGSSRLGRVAFVRDGGPMILPVNHAMDGMTIVFRTTWGSKLLVAESAKPVAFEVDGFDRLRGCGWSVLATGTAARVYHDADIARYEALRVDSWAPPAADVAWIAIRPDEITGRETA